jgi:predicted transposase/invertase (TIGR01784 family)
MSFVGSLMRNSPIHQVERQIAMDLKRMPHDAFVKGMMGDLRVAKDFFLAHLPSEVLERVLLDSIQAEFCTFVDESLGTGETDLLYSVCSANGEQAYLYLLVEHQRNSDSLMSFRLQYYIMQILKRHVEQQGEKEDGSVLPLPLIYPVVFYNGAAKFTANRDIFMLFGQQEALAREVFLKPFQLVDVSTIEDEALRKHQWAGVMEWCLRHSVERDFLPYVRCLGELVRSLGIKDRDKLFLYMLNYIISGMETQEKCNEAVLALRQEMPPHLESNVVTIAEQLHNEGVLKGRLEGKLEGRLEGKLEGRLEGVEATLKAIKLLGQGVSIADVSRETGLSPEIVKQMIPSTVH